MSNNDKQILANSIVTLHFSLALENGTVAISTFDEEPMTITMGEGAFQPDMELALYCLKENDEQTLTLTPEQAYGYPNPELIQQLPRNEFPDDMELQPGQVIAFSLPNGEEMPGLIQELGDDKVKVDFNHPLCGHSVVFKVKILKISEPVIELNAGTS